MKSKRYQTETEIIADIDRLKDEVPALYERAQAAKREAEQYFAKHLQDESHLSIGDEIAFNYKKLRIAAKRAASAPIRHEKKIKLLSEALAEFRTERMEFLSAQSVEVKS